MLPNEVTKDHIAAMRKLLKTLAHEAEMAQSLSDELDDALNDPKRLQHIMVLAMITADQLKYAGLDYEQAITGSRKRVALQSIKDLLGNDL